MLRPHHYYYDEDGVPVRAEPLDRDLRRQRFVSRLSGVVGFLFAIIYVIVGMRVVLEALAAREGNRFKELIDGLSAPFLAMFEGLLPSVFLGRFELVLSYVFALIVYALIHYAIQRLIWAVARR